MSMNEMYIQCIGIKRATATIGLMNLTYNTTCFVKFNWMQSRDKCVLTRTSKIIEYMYINEI
jgi:hypothetical protein